MTVLVTGIRGTIAGRVATALHEAGEEVRGTSSRGPSDDHPFPVVGLALRDPSGLPAALDGVDRVLLYAPETGADRVASALRDAGVTKVVLISSASVLDPRLEPISQHHADAERRVTDAVDVVTLLRPGVFASNALRWAWSMHDGRVALPFPDAYAEPIHTFDVADAAVTALTTPSLDGQTVTMTGPESLTHREQLAILGDVLGTSIDVGAQAPGEWREQMAAYMPAPAADALLEVWAGSDEPGSVEYTLREATGSTPRTFRTWAEQNVGAFAQAVAR